MKRLVSLGVPLLISLMLASVAIYWRNYRPLPGQRVCKPLSAKQMAELDMEAQLDPNYEYQAVVCREGNRKDIYFVPVSIRDPAKVSNL